MEAINYISIDYVLEVIKRRNPWIDSVNYYDVCEYIAESYGLIGAPKIYIDQITGNSLKRPNVEVEDWAGELPPDLVNIKPGGVRDADTGIVYRHSTDTFHKAPKFTGDSPRTSISDKTYSVRDGFIYINQQEATLQIAYKAIPVDDRGFPKIVDKPRFRKAIENTILYYEGWKRKSVGRMDRDTWREIKQDYHWWLASAETESKMFHPDEAESAKNAFVRLYPKINFHQSSFKFAGIQEDIRTGNNSYNR
jgi:hypothetical protein